MEGDRQTERERERVTEKERVREGEITEYQTVIHFYCNCYCTQAVTSV